MFLQGGSKLESFHNYFLVNSTDSCDSLPANRIGLIFIENLFAAKNLIANTDTKSLIGSRFISYVRSCRI